MLPKCQYNSSEHQLKINAMQCILKNNFMWQQIKCLTLTVTWTERQWYAEIYAQ